jgi:hypothetical protein
MNDISDNPPIPSISSRSRFRKSPFAHDHPTSVAQARLDNQFANIELASSTALIAELVKRGYTIWPTSRIEIHADHWRIKKTDSEMGIKRRSR